MADVTELRCWPACLNAIDWSPEGIIALASDERVELLFPNTIAFDRDQEGAQWQHIPLLVPLFSKEELPVKDPAALETYSIGEEISASAPISIAWSPSGLAKHRRCALATLTTNLVLSLWAADGKLQDRSSWTRKLILNDALSKYFSAKGTQSIEQVHLGSRIRAFTWAPLLPSCTDTHSLGSRISYSPNMLAICNDNNQLVIVLVGSPTSFCSPGKHWRAKGLAHLSVGDPHTLESHRKTLYGNLIREQRYISHVAWSPWIFCGELHKSMIAYATNTEIRGRIVTSTGDTVNLGEDILISHMSLRFNGPMRWSPVIDEHDELQLALFTKDGLIYVTVSLNDGSVTQKFTDDLDGRWDQTSGAVWDVGRDSTPRIHFSSLLSTINNSTCVLEKHASGLQAGDNPTWRDQVQNSAVLFSVKNDLNGNSKVKVWGLAISPLRDFIATCTSVHPSDMIEYGSPNDRRGTVAVSALRQYRQIRHQFPSFDVTAEGVLFTLKKLKENTIEEPGQIPVFAEEMVTELLRAYASPLNSTGKDSRNGGPFRSNQNDPDEIIRELKQQAYFNHNTLRDRYSILVSYACSNKLSNELATTLIAYRLAKCLNRHSLNLSRSSLSNEIMNHHEHLISMISTLANPKRGDSDEFQNLDVAETGASIATGAMSSYNALNDKSFATDTCNFCAMEIPFTDLVTATCPNGHQFPRCGLSLLTIQAPGITKYCGICSTPFLSEEYISLQEETDRLDEEGLSDVQATDSRVLYDVLNTAPESSGTRALADVSIDSVSNSDSGRLDRSGLGRGKPSITLAQLLFSACDACIYCGGKYVG